MRLAVPFSTLEAEVSTSFGAALTPGQQRTLALWVAGTVVAGSSCQTLVTAALVETLGVGRTDTVRQRLREFVYDGAEHSAPAPGQVDPTACFAPLLGWLLGWGCGPRVALALDVTTHTDRLTAIVVSVLLAGRAIPVAWHLLPGQQPGAFMDPALGLLITLAAAVRPGDTVTLAADRGLWSPRLADQVTALGWVPLLRVQRDVRVWLGRGQCVRADRLVAGPGHAWVGRVAVHRDRARRRIQTVVVVWEVGHAEPWVVFTTGTPAAALLRAYGLRMWIEAGFRDLKRMGWQWERTRRTDPVRVARHWLVLAVATAWVLAHGGEDPGAPPPPRRPPPLSAFQRGRLRLLGVLLGRRPQSRPRLAPVVWPDDRPSHLTVTVGPAEPPYLPRARPSPASVNHPL